MQFASRREHERRCVRQVMDGNVPCTPPPRSSLAFGDQFLAALNMFSMAHPTYHVSWGGLLTFEATNAAFGDAKDGFHFEVLGDTIFIAACLGLIAFGARTVNQTVPWPTGQGAAHQRHVWPALNDPSLGGGQRTHGCLVLLLGLAFYLYFGISHSGWIDVGVYSVFIALMASGFALNHASRVPPATTKLTERLPLVAVSTQQCIKATRASLAITLRSTAR